MLGRTGLAEACVAGETLRVQRRKGGQWVTKKIGVTTDTGNYAVKTRVQGGRYRILAPESAVGDGTSCRKDPGASVTI